MIRTIRSTSKRLMSSALLCAVLSVNAWAETAEATANVRVTGDAVLTATHSGGTSVSLEKPAGRATVTFHFQETPLNLSAFRDIAIRSTNGTDAELDVLVNATSSRDLNWRNSTTGRFLVRPGETYDMAVLMTRPELGKDHPHVKRLGDLYAFPWGHQQHWRNMEVSSVRHVSLRISWNKASAGQVIEIDTPRGSGSYSTDPALLKTLEMPLVDRFGQLRKGDWPGKVVDAGELVADGQKDVAWAATITKPAGARSRFGGMTGGPELKATGFFRVEKINGKWWFVDPEGHLFWSHGINAIGGATETRVAGREDLFSKEQQGAPTARHYWDNLKLKFGGEDWINRQVDLIVARMLDWGLNTVGAWSRAELLSTQRIPYTLIIHTDMSPLGSNKKIADPFSDKFKTSLDRIMGPAAAGHAASPWLLGVFIDNELNWGGDNALVEDIIQSPSRAPARVALVDFLRERYEHVDALNKAWDTRFESFAVIQAKPGPHGGKAYDKDLGAFMAIFTDRYFKLCREAMQKHFPNHLYLGARFHQFNPVVTAAASRHCDVISLNIYQHSFDGFSIKTDQDRPWIISEFHFGVRDHGVWGTGLTWAADARNQADLYQAYLSDALRHPNYVGAHWFLWTNQTVTGRADGENFGVGLVTIVDRPVATLIDAVRNVSHELYDFRLSDAPGRIGGETPQPVAASGTTMEVSTP